MKRSRLMAGLTVSSSKLKAQQEKRRKLQEQQEEEEAKRSSSTQPKFQQRQQQQQQQQSSSRQQKQQQPQQSAASFSRPKHQQLQTTGDHISEQELKDIKEDYLGLKKVKKRHLKAADRHKLAFGWNEEDDTSRDLNPIYDSKYEPKLMFGRGRRAGVDMADREKVKTHWSEKHIRDMDSRDWRILREDFEISVKGGKVPNPIRSWEESDLPDEIFQVVTRLGFEKPSPIQMQCIPIGLQRRDLIGLAETGSGKTLAYMIPMLVYISQLPRLNAQTAANGPYGMVLVPTRELAQQIEQASKEFAKEFGIRVFSVTGGVSVEQQMFLMREGCEIIIGTPGRLIDCLDNSYIVLNQCTYVVLDEADRMIDMDFEADINRILEDMPPALRPEDENEEDSKAAYRQTTMFSATMPLELEQLASKYLRRRVIVTIGEVGKAVQRIEQTVQFLRSENEKMKALIYALEDAEPPVIIFFNTKKDVDSVAKYLDRTKGFRVATIHGDKSQDVRERALDGFKKGHYDVLAATDVIGRGIDIPGVTLVVNYDMPKKISTYTHRIGRTGRAGATGRAISLMTEADSDIAHDLKQMLASTNNLIPEELEQLVLKVPPPNPTPKKKEQQAILK